MSRCIKAVPSQKENLSEFMVGLNTNSSVEIIQATFDTETRKLSHKILYDFGNQKENYNDILGIYSEKREYDEKNDIFCQIFNDTTNNYELKMLSCGEEIKLVDLPKCKSENIFGY